MALTVEVVREALKECYDPEIPVNIVDLGLVYEIRVDGNKVFVRMTLTSPGCPVGPQLIADVKAKVSNTGAEETEVDLVFDPPWSPEKMSLSAKAQLGL